MSLFWNKKIQNNKKIYTRTKTQTRWLYILVIIGLFWLIFFQQF